jgi:hypothetical protein
MTTVQTSVSPDLRTLSPRAALVSLAALAAAAGVAACASVISTGGGGGSGGAATVSGFGAASAGALGCVSGKAEVLEQTLSSHIVATDATSLYFGSTYGSVNNHPTWQIYEMGKDGGAPSLVTSGTDTLAKVAVDAESVYLFVGHCDGAHPCTGDVSSFPKGGGPRTVLYSGGGNLDFTVTDPHLVYIVTVDGDESQVLSVPKTGGAATVIASAPALGLLSIAAALIVDDAPSDDRLYWFNGAGILATPKDGAGPTVTLSADPGVVRIVADAQNLYWATYYRGADPSAGAVLTVPKSGGPTATLVSPGAEVWDLALDERCLYWTQFPPSTPDQPIGDGPMIVAAMPKTGGGAAVVDTGDGLTQAMRLTVDDSGLYVAKPAGTTPPNGPWPPPLPSSFMGPLDKIAR